MNLSKVLVPFYGNINEKSTPDGRVEKLNSLFQLVDASRRPHEVDWYSNSMYLWGNQLDDLPTDVRQLLGRRIVGAKRKRRVEYVANRVFALVRQGASYLADNIGRQVATAATTEEQDILSAELGTQLLEYFRQETTYREERLQDILWCMITGRILIKVEWDPDMPGQTNNGWRMGAGDVSTSTLSPLNFYVDPWVSKLSEASFVLETRLRDVDEVKDTFDIKDLEPEGAQDSTYLLDSLLNAITTNTMGNYSSSAPKRDNAILVKTWYFAPTLKHPKGLVIWQAGKKELHQSELPEGVMPFVELAWLRIPGSAYPMSFITPLRNPSHYHNVLKSQMIQLANAQLRGDTIRRGEGQVQQDVDPETGRKDLYVDSSVQQFEMMKYQLDYAAAAKTMEDMWDDQQQIAGLRASMIGENPPGVQTVGQLLLLKEPDTAGLALFKGSFESGYAKVGKLELLVAKNHYKEQRLIRVTGQDQIPNVTAFLGSDLAGVADVVIRPMPMMSEAQKRQAIQEANNLRQFGPYENIQDKRSKLKALMNSGIPGIEEDVRRIAAPLTMAQLEEAAGMADMLQFALQEKTFEAQVVQLEAMLAQFQQQMQMQAQGTLQEQQLNQLMSPGANGEGEAGSVPSQKFPGGGNSGMGPLGNLNRSPGATAPPEDQLAKMIAQQNAQAGAVSITRK